MGLVFKQKFNSAREAFPLDNRHNISHESSDSPINETKERNDLGQFPNALALFVEAVHWLSVYYSLALIVAGCACNLLSFIVFTRKAFRHTPTSIYLRFLALVDLGAILSGFLRFFILRAFGQDIRSNEDEASCRTHLCFAAFFLFCSSWTLVIVTAERMASIVWPHRVHIWCTKLTARLGVCLLITVNGLMCLPYVFLYGSVSLIDSRNKVRIRRCRLVYNSNDLNAVMVSYFTVYQAFLPSLIIVICNIIIIYGVIHSRKRVGRPLRNTQPSSGGATSAIVPGPESDHLSSGDPDTQSSVCHDLKLNRKTLRSNARRRTQYLYLERTERATDKFKEIKPKHGPAPRREISLTVTLLVVSTAFIICNFPNATFEQAMYHLAAKEGILRETVSDLIDLFLFTNNSLNFALYCFAGSRFRAEVKAFLSYAFSCRWIVKAIQK